jgi:hypothetical protein
MFDAHARELIGILPELRGLNRDDCRRALSDAYFQIVRTRVGGLNNERFEADTAVVRTVLRRMGDALESVAVFDPLNGIRREAPVENASAFVAAEAIALLGGLLAVGVEPQAARGDLLRDAQHYARLESALLYMIGGYDINAASRVNDLPQFTPAAGIEELVPATARNALYLISRLKAFCQGDVRPSDQPYPPYRGFDTSPVLYEQLIVEVRLRCYETLGKATNVYLDWLGGRDPQGLETARTLLNDIRTSVSGDRFAEFSAFSDVHHLASLIQRAFDQTSRRSVLHNVPRPPGIDAQWAARFEAYLVNRVSGTPTQRGRVFLWPSAQQFIDSCLPGPRADSLVAMPTGSGKSFVAELAIADALCRGNVLYLAPTNTLVHQVRADLAKAFAPLKEIRVLAFIGSGEYSGILDDIFEEIGDDRFVAVMTPEKCSLALRLASDAFRDLVLCVFDECHLLNDANRGITADILMAQLFAAAPQMSFVLMSAMVSNPEELAAWLADARQSKASVNVTKWRPSRTLRGLVAVNKAAAQATANAAVATLQQIRKTQPRRVREKFSAELLLVAGMSGPWTLEGPDDYRVAALPVIAEGAIEIQAGRFRPVFEGWKNSVARSLAESLARARVPVIAFILSSRHHAFSLATQIVVHLPGAPSDSGGLVELVEAWLGISDAELGVPTALRPLLNKGVAVHTSAMLQTEQAAAEWMFQHSHASLMFATPTLAQGLNLPAVAVIVAGTSMGDPRDAREADQIAGVGTRADATILNSFGRAGRPGFANHGVAVLVGDKPSFVDAGEAFNATTALAQNAVLSQPDATVNVISPIEAFLDRALVNADPFTTASQVELELTTLLAENPVEDHAGRVLRRTFAGYRKRQVLTEAAADLVTDRIAALKDNFLNQPGLPEWLNTAAMKAGVDMFRAWRMWEAYQQRGLMDFEAGKSLSVMQWLTVFIETMAKLPPRRVEGYMADESVAATRPAVTAQRGRVPRVTVLKSLRDAAGNQRHVDTVPWNAPADWDEIWQKIARLAAAYMSGDTYAQIASAFLNIPLQDIDGGRRTGQPIPAVFGLIRKVFEPLARDAGCFVALTEYSWSNAEESRSAAALQSLPLCLRYGCNDMPSLAWFRFGYRQRACAHALSEAFPPPAELGEADLAKWVRSTMGKWVAGEIVPDTEQQHLFENARKVITQAGD